MHQLSLPSDSGLYMPGMNSEFQHPGRFLEFDMGERARPQGTLYNPSTAFYDISDGHLRRIMLGRDENIGSESDSEVVACDYNTRQLIENAPVFKLSQDPYYLGKFRDADDEFWQVIGMVRITVDSEDKVTSWRDVLYRYKDSIMELGNEDRVVDPWMEGPEEQKDLRFMPLFDNILCTPRPQGKEFGGLGSVARFITKNLDTLPKDLERFFRERDPDTIIKGLSAKGHWNAIGQFLGRYPGTNYVKAIGHDAHVGDDNLRHYEGTYSWFDYETLKVVGSFTVATADSYQEIDPKPGHGLGKIVFSSGVIEGGRGLELITGVADRAIGVVPIDIKGLDRKMVRIVRGLAHAA